MVLDEPLWRKALKLKSKYDSNNSHLSREAIIAELQINERDARYIYDVLRDLPVITTRADDIGGYVQVSESLSSTKKELKEAKAHIAKLQRSLEIHAQLANARLDIPRWMQPPISGRDDSMACTMLSDVHADEIIDPAQINWSNKYDRPIAEGRLKTYFSNVIRLSRDYCSGVNIKGLVAFINGDIVSGNIHDELRETNEYPIVDTVLHYSEILATGLVQWLDHFKRVYVVSVPGNHGRFDQKVRHKGAVKDNWDYLLAHLVARELEGERGIKIYIPDAPDAYVPVYNTTFGVTHGNQFRGGSGWMGSLGPAMRGDRKKRERQIQLRMPYDVLLLGHFHQYNRLSNIIMNGSLVGYSEYSSNNNFPFEKPQQAFWLTHPEHGVTIQAPVRCTSKDENWREEAAPLCSF